MVRTMPEVPRSPRGVLVNSPLGTAPIVGPIELLSCLLHLPLFQKCPLSEDLNGCVGLNHSGGFPEFSYSCQWFSYRQSFATVAGLSMGFLQSVSRARCGKHDTVSQPAIILALSDTHHWSDHCPPITLEIFMKKIRSGKHDTACRSGIIPASCPIVVGSI